MSDSARQSHDPGGRRRARRSRRARHRLEDRRRRGRRRFSVVHHPLAPRALAAPLHRHTREDEYSYVLEGTLGALLGDDVVTAEPGTWVFKPRDQWHTFWNAGDTPCEIIEIISPAGFENFFRELPLVYGADGEPDIPRFVELCARYALEMDPSSVPGLCERFGLTHPMANG